MLFTSNLDVNVTAYSALLTPCPLNEKANIETTCYWPENDGNVQYYKLRLSLRPFACNLQSWRNWNDYLIVADM